MPCARSSRSPAGARSVPARSRSPAASTRYCRRRSASARPAPRRSRRPASPSPICGKLRTGRRQDVAVDRRQATASLRSGHYMKLDGAQVSTERNAVMGVYPAKNGRWSYLHCNFPNHRAAALSVLGVPEDREVVREAVAKWDALELEEAIIAAKGAGGMVRSMEEWAKHPQAAAIASLPLMEIVKIGDSPPEKLPDGDRPLSGLRVLDHRSEEHTSELQSQSNLVCRLLLEKKKKIIK